MTQRSAKPPAPASEIKHGGTVPRRLVYSLLAGMLLLHALLLGYLATVNSVTYDEHAHLPAGLAYLKYGDYSIYGKSPPLLRWWAAWPVLAYGATVPPLDSIRERPAAESHAAFGDAFMLANLDRYPHWFVLARWSMIPLSCLTAWLVYLWAAKLFGAVAGLAACALYVIEPNVLAHAPLVTTDVGSGAFFLLALWLWQRFGERPNWQRATLAGVAVGLAHLCKFTAFLLWPILLLQALVWVRRGAAGQWRRFLAGGAVAVVLTLGIVNMAYGFRGTMTPLRDYSFVSRTMSELKSVVGWLPVPFPREFVSGFDRQKIEAEGSFQGFLFGEYYSGSRWYYYPVALACKLPLALLAMIGLAIAAAFRRTSRAGGEAGGAWMPLSALLVFALGMTVLAQINIGIRYLLPIFPLGIILLGSLWQSPRSWRARLATLLLACMAVESGLGFPHYLSYFNVAAGGERNGWRVLGSSNFDWGQGLVGLADWMKKNDVKRIHLANFGLVDPRAYGIDYVPLNEPAALPWVAVSGHFFGGGRARICTPSGPSREFFGLPFYLELQERQPVARVGGVIFLYRQSDVAAAQAEFARKHPRPK